MTILFTRTKTVTRSDSYNTGKMTLSVTGKRESGGTRSPYDIVCTLDTEYVSNVDMNFKIEKFDGTDWVVLRTIKTTLPRNPAPGNIAGAGTRTSTFTDVSDSNRSKMRIRVKVAGYDPFACDSWNENNF